MASLTGDDSDRQPIETYMEPLIEEIETGQSNDINLEVIFSQIRDLIVSPKPRGKKLGSNRKRWKKKCQKCEIFVMPPNTHLRDNFDFENLNVSFNGCGFLGVYHVGVACALNHYLKDMKFKNICGASAGAMAAVCLIAGCPLDEMASDLMKASNDIRHTAFGAFNPAQNVTQKLRNSLERLLPENIHELANGKLHISVTDVYTGKNVLINNYRDKREVIDVVVSSTYIPVFSGIFPPRYRRKRCIDGGFSVNQVILEDDLHATLTVSPFSGDAHICPKSKRKHRTGYTRLQFAEAWTDLSWENFDRMRSVVFPQSPDEMSALLLAGYHDAVAFLARYGQLNASCGTCLTVKTTFSPQDVLKEEEANISDESDIRAENDSRLYSRALLKSIKKIDGPDKILPENRYKVMGIMLPTLNEMLYDYNPYYHVCKYCMHCSATIAKKGFGVAQNVIPFVPDWSTLVHAAEDAVSNVIGVLAPRIFGIKTAKVIPNECECDAASSMQGKARFSCEFHITQDDAYDDEEDSEGEDYSEDEDDEEDEDLATSTLMSVHLDTFLDKRYKWYKKRKEQLPRPIRYIVMWLMDILGIHYHCLMFWVKNHSDVIENLITYARQVSLGTMS